MSKFIRSVSLFVVSLPLLPLRLAGAVAQAPTPDVDTHQDLEPVSLRPLNNESDNLFARHSSHSSHRSHSSHSSHYSGSGGSTSRSPTPYSPPSESSAPVPSPQRLIDEPVNSRPSSPAPPPVGLSPVEKLRLQVLRVQIKLKSLGLYDAAIDGSLNEETREALRLFQQVKGLEETGMMSTPTLNALGVPAAN
jgi:His-Xaa-Ser repeat protein HxsA